MTTLTINKENFESEVLQATKPVLLDFWASWCIPCKMISPLLEEIAEEAPDALVGKINIDEQPELAEAFDVMSIPMLTVIKDGQIMDSMVGVRPKSEILEMLDLYAKASTALPVS